MQNIVLSAVLIAIRYLHTLWNDHCGKSSYHLPLSRIIYNIIDHIPYTVYYAHALFIL